MATGTNYIAALHFLAKAAGLAPDVPSLKSDGNDFLIQLFIAVGFNRRISGQQKRL